MDKFDLYTAAFQEPAIDVAIFRRLYHDRAGSQPHSLREDFCGSAAVAREWVRSDPLATAVGIDNDEEPLVWADSRWRRESLEHEHSRLTLHHADVRTFATEPVDVLCALNGSFCTFKSRRVLLEYLRRCRSALASNGLFVLHVYTGPDAHRVGSDQIALGSCTCIWDQAEFDSATHHAVNHVHFEHSDGTRLERAFTYNWRLWTPPELYDVLEEAGFRNIDVHLVKNRVDLLGCGNKDSAPCVECWEAYVIASP